MFMGDEAMFDGPTPEQSVMIEVWIKVLPDAAWRAGILRELKAELGASPWSDQQILAALFATYAERGLDAPLIDLS
jgi:hypothetical protein